MFNHSQFMLLVLSSPVLPGGPSGEYCLITLYSLTTSGAVCSKCAPWNLLFMGSFSKQACGIDPGTAVIGKLNCNLKIMVTVRLISLKTVSLFTDRLLLFGCCGFLCIFFPLLIKNYNICLE